MERSRLQRPAGAAQPPSAADPAAETAVAALLGGRGGPGVPGGGWGSCGGPRVSDPPLLLLYQTRLRFDKMRLILLFHPSKGWMVSFFKESASKSRFSCFPPPPLAADAGRRVGGSPVEPLVRLHGRRYLLFRLVLLSLSAAAAPDG